MQGFRGPVERWGGRGSCGGASELVGGSEGWPEAVAKANGGDGVLRPRARESEGETGERVSESRGDRDGLRASSTRPGGRRQAGGGRAAVRARARSSFGARGGRRRRATVLGWVGCWLGRPAGWAEQGRAQVSFSLLVFFLFSVLFNISATLLN